MTAAQRDAHAVFALLAAAALVLCAPALAATKAPGGVHVLTAAEAGGLSFAAATASPSVSHGLHDLPPAVLARLLLRDPDHERPADLLQKANAA